MLISGKNLKEGIGGGTYAQMDERWYQSVFPDITSVKNFYNVRYFRQSM